MGVSGAGKSTIGQALAQYLGWKFLDADDFHPPANIAKMAAAIALEDADRWPWLDAINAVLRRESKAVVACSALKQAYRERLTRGLAATRLVYLHGSPALIRQRLKQRRHRFMSAALLDSQLAALEPPAQAIAIDVAGEVQASVAAIAAQLSADRESRAPPRA
jgi:gluconokinase